MPAPATRQPAALITGVILAGGQGTRMGGVDKGLQLHGGKALVRHVAERLTPQVAQLMINANRNEAAYAAFGYPVFADQITGFAGPLAGLHAALSVANTPLVLTAPCDSPGLPLDLVSRLDSALQASHANLAIAKAGGRLHPVFCLCRRFPTRAKPSAISTPSVISLKAEHDRLETSLRKTDIALQHFRAILDAQEQ